MSGPEFFQTMMGRTYYEGTMPKLARGMQALNENVQTFNGTMARIATALETIAAAQGSAPKKEES